MWRLVIISCLVVCGVGCKAPPEAPATMEEKAAFNEVRDTWELRIGLPDTSANHDEAVLDLQEEQGTGVVDDEWHENVIRLREKEGMLVIAGGQSFTSGSVEGCIVHLFDNGCYVEVFCDAVETAAALEPVIRAALCAKKE